MDKKILTPKIAEEFAKQKYKEIKPKEDADFNLVHAKAVVRTALLLSKNKKLDDNLIAIASWLHDIGKSIKEGSHSENSIKILEKENFEISDKLRDCILNHGTNGKPSCEEARIINIADKASIIDRDMLKVIAKYTLKKTKSERKADLEFIKKLANGGAELLGEY